MNNKKATMNPTNEKDNKFVQYTVTVVLNHEKIGNNSEKMTMIKPLIKKYKYEGINFPQKKMIGKKLRKIM